MNIENAPPADEIHVGGHSIETVKGFCGIPARLTGFFSWCMQLSILLLGVVLTLLIFVHIGGYAYVISVANNATDIPSIIDEDLATSFETSELVSNVTEYDTIETTRVLSENETVETKQKVFHGPFEQIDEVQMFITDRWVINLLPALRTFNILFILFCFFWLISLGCLLLSLKLEILDLVIVNFLALVIGVVTMLIQAGIIAILLFYQKDYNWPILLVISGTVGGLLFCFIIGMMAISLNVVWYKYIDYMNNQADACVCLSSITHCIKRRKRGGQREHTTVAAGYTIPEATSPSGLPYIDDPVHHFDNF
uniref:Transmembrane protein n=1 Tax=Panagrellus redivivus TaxID=6233 RepID=A0A7E4VKY0_PANRE